MPSPLDLVPSVLNFISGQATNAYNARTAKELAAQSNQWSIEQWNRENEYNSPKNQMARLQEAGINPALAYANGVFNQAATSPDVTTPSINSKAPSVDPLLFANLRKLEAETESIEHDTERKDELQPFSIANMQAEIAKARSFVNNLDIQSQKTLSDMSIDWLRYNIDYNKAVSQIDLWNSQKGINDELKLKTHEEYIQLVALYSLREENLHLTNEEIRAQLRIDDKELEVMDARIKLMEDQGLAANASALSDLADASLLEFRENLMREQSELYDAQGEYYDDYREHTGKYNTHYHFGATINASLRPDEWFNPNKENTGETPYGPDGQLKKGYYRKGKDVYKQVGKKWIKVGKILSRGVKLL